MINNIKAKINSNSFQNSIDTYANHMLVILAFFLSIDSDSMLKDAFIVFSLLFIFKTNKIQLLKEALSNKIVIAFLLYGAVYYFGLLFSDDLHKSYWLSTHFKFTAFIIFIFIFIQHKFTHRIIFSFLLGIFSVAVIFLLLKYQFLDRNLPIFFTIHSTNNFAPFSYHIANGLFLVIGSSLLFLTYLIKENKLDKLFIISMFFVISIVVFLDIGRTGYILYPIGLFIVIFLRFKKDSLKILPIFLIAMFISAVLAFNYLHTFKSRVLKLQDDIVKIENQQDYHTSLGLRIVQTKQAVNLFLESPFFGYGTNMHVKTMYEDAKEKKLFYANTIKRYYTTDSQYLDTLLQFGTLGFIIFLNIFYQAFRYKQKDFYLRSVRIVLLSLLLIYFIQTGISIDIKVYYTFFFIIAVTMTQAKDDEQPLKQISKSAVFIYGIFIILSFILSEFIV